MKRRRRTTHLSRPSASGAERCLSDSEHSTPDGGIDAIAIFSTCFCMGLPALKENKHGR